MQKTLQNLAETSLMFFVIFGGLHISCSLLLANNGVSPVPQFLFNVLDLPFLLAALLYGTARFSLALEFITGNLKIPTLACSVFAGMAFLGALYFNFFLPDANLF